MRNHHKPSECRPSKGSVIRSLEVGFLKLQVLSMKFSLVLKVTGRVI
jgi:hypothetical protein